MVAPERGIIVPFDTLFLGWIGGRISDQTIATVGKDQNDILDWFAYFRDVTGKDSVWTGLFVYEGGMDQQVNVMKALGAFYEETKRVINAVSVGANLFSRYWKRGTDVHSAEKGPVWHSYELKDVAPSYFIGISWTRLAPSITASKVTRGSLHSAERNNTAGTTYLSEKTIPSHTEPMFECRVEQAGIGTILFG